MVKGGGVARDVLNRDTCTCAASSDEHAKAAKKIFWLKMKRFSHELRESK
jgi:hypothetical protein